MAAKGSVNTCWMSKCDTTYLISEVKAKAMASYSLESSTALDTQK